MYGVDEDNMIRRISLAVFSLTFLLSACGRQVTGIAVPGASPTPSALSGEMEIKFRTFGAMDFNNVNYMIVFNTSGIGGEPYANAFATTFCNYSFAFAIGPTYGTANAALYQIFIPPGSTRPAFNQLTLAPGTTSLVLNPNGQQTEFDLTFARSQFNIPSPVIGPANPCVAATAVPSPNSTATPNASATSTTTAQIWYMNLFTTNTAGAPLDALGFGVSDTSFVQSIDTSASVDQTIIRQPGAQQPPAQSEFISGFEIINSP
jgi:hypothetical protein